MFKHHETQIDTNESGLIFDLPHNLGGDPLIFLSEPTSMGDYKIVSLYDSRIISIESKGPDVTRFTFSSTFQGKVRLLLPLENYYPVEEKIEDIDRKLSDIIVMQRQFVVKNQWSKMNSLLESIDDGMRADIKKLQSDYALLKQEVRSL